MSAHDATARSLVLKQQLHLAGLLRDIDELQAELEDLERRVREVNDHRIGAKVAIPPARVEDLGHQVAEALLRRGRADVRAALEQAERDATAVYARARDHARDLAGAARQGQAPTEWAGAPPGIELVPRREPENEADAVVGARFERPHDGTLTFAPRPPAPDGPTVNGTSSAPWVAQRAVVPEVEDRSALGEEGAPEGLRRWARPAEILLHLVILLALIVVALSAFR